MPKMVRLNDDVYFALKARALREGKTLSGAVYALMHTADYHAATEKRLASLESTIDQLMRRFPVTNDSSREKAKKERPSRDLNPSRSLDRAP